MVLKGNLTFLFFFRTVSVKLGQKICGFTDIGVSKLRQKVVSLRLGVSVGVEARPPHPPNTPSLNEYHLLVSIFETPISVNTTDFLSKFH